MKPIKNRVLIEDAWRAEHVLPSKENERRLGSWSFDPTQFGFRIEKRWSRSITDPKFDKADYWYQASRTVREAYKNGSIHYTCIINKIGAKDYRFTVTGNKPAVFEYNVPNMEVVKIILGDLIPADQWHRED